MAQHDYVIANGTGAAVRSDLNAGFAAIVSQNSGATAPSTTYAYQSWADTTAGMMKMRNGANNAWITLYQLDGEWTSIAFENGTAAAPSIYFKDSGTDTGIYSPGADQVAISTGGTSRLAVSTTAVSSTLAVDVPLGAVGTPSITFTGDLNTGVFSPGADTLALVTGGTNRVHVTSAGLVGIGTSSPAGKAEIVSSGSESTLILRNASSAGSTYSELKFAPFTGTTAAAAAIRAEYYTSNDSTLAFRTTATNAEPTTKLFIDNTGNVGIGTTSPGYLLDVNGEAAVGVGAANSNDYAFRVRAGTSGLSRFIAADTSDIGYIDYDHSSNAWIFRPAGSERARLDSSGRLLVGTIASPAHQLQVSTDSAGKPSTNTWTIVSDERIKEEIELADLDLCYEAVKSIPLKRFKWKNEVYTEEQVRDRRKLGWIAQDVEAVFPKAVGTYEFKYNQVFEETIIPAVEEELDADGNVITPAQPERIEQGDLISEDVIEDCRDLNSDQLYAAMYGAVQKLMAKVETLEASNADMVARLFALEGA